MPKRDISHDRLPRDGEIYFEHRRVGRFLRTSAIDAASGLEVTVMGPANADQRHIEHTALRKLYARMGRES